MSTVTVTIWGNKATANQAVLDFITADVGQASAIVATAPPWSSPPLDPAIAQAFSAAILNGGGHTAVA
jgi:hypothetical protein